MLQCVLQCVAVPVVFEYNSEPEQVDVLLCVAVCCSVLQCVVVCCSACCI